jgi:hypothetical protein
MDWVSFSFSVLTRQAIYAILPSCIIEINFLKRYSIHNKMGNDFKINYLTNISIIGNIISLISDNFIAVF